MRRNLRAAVVALWVLTIFANVLVLFTPTRAASAQGGFEIVATNLNNPRGLSFGSDGALYIAEAGQGGPEPCLPNPEGGPPVCYGATGSITRVMSDTQERIVMGLPSLATQEASEQPPLPPGSQASGPHDVLVMSDTIYAIVGLGANPAARDTEPEFADFGYIVSADMEGNWETMTDLAAYEADANPDGSKVPDSNPYSLTSVNTDTMLAVDAGGNDLLSITNGTVMTEAIFLPRFVDFMSSSIPMDAVPTAVQVGPDGAYYVSQLTGFPFPVGGANIYRIDPADGPTAEPEVYASGFTNVVDLAFGAEGELYVLEFAQNGLLSGDPTGAIIRVSADGTTTDTVASTGLIAPGGITYGRDGMLYVSNFSVFPEAPPQPELQGGQPTGTVIRLDPNAPTAVTVGTLSTQQEGNLLRPALGLLALATTATLLVLRRRRR